MKKTIIITPTSSKKQTEALAEVIKLGIDIHKKKYVVVRQIDQQSPQSPQRFSPAKFLVWVEKQRGLDLRVVSCYEAGCFGYVLHRKLEALGVENLVVRPRNWDEYGKRIKTDKRDAKELCSHLDRYLAGNKEALCVVRVPTPQQERERSLSRQRETLAKELQRLQNVGTSNGLYNGIELASKWWKPKVFEELKQNLPEFFIKILEPYQAILVVVDQQLKQATAREERTANRLLPVGLGALTTSVLDREFVDYTRFTNRGQVASFTGLCPTEASTGNNRRQGSINKHGNPRIRHMLLEATWRMFYFQPDYQPILYWKERMLNEPFNAAKKKKMAVAIARQFAVDWWRIQTGRMSAETVGLRLAYPAAYATKVLRLGRISKVHA
jgi:transposase